MYDFVNEIHPTLLYYNVLSPFPGTEIARYCRENNLIDTDIPYERYEVGQILRNGLIKGIDYNRVREWLPKFASCTRNADPLSIGIMFEQSNNYKDAIEHYRKAEKSLRSIYHIASLLKRTGRHTEALIFFKEIDKFKCNGSNSYYFAQHHFHRGEIFYERGEFDKAREDFMKCVELLPNHKKAKEYIMKLNM
jgi:tetratricopeptide (TPR) repeat protein